MKHKHLFLAAVMLLLCGTASAQRVMDKIDRGLVAVPASSGSGNLVSWRVFGEEYYDVTYNLYCNGTKIASNLKASNYSHTAGNASSKYQVAAVVRGVEQPLCDAVTRWENGMLTIPVQKITGRDGTDVTSNYTINDISMGDLDGDGVVEFICKRPCSVASDVSQKNCFHVLDAYDRTGKRLWWIDLGPNMLAGADEQWDCVCYDWDQDGKAEVLLRIQDNAYIHYEDGSTELIGSSSVDTRWSGIEYTSTGNEYLLYLEGATGKPYDIGPDSHPHYMDYPNPRGQDSDWGTGIVGHRSTKHYFAAPYLDGRHPSIFLGRGCYTKHMMKAFDVNPENHKLTQRWAWECSTSGIWFGQGYHNFQVADVDWDGRDEIVFGSMVIDDNGKGLSTTGLGHGDAQHCSDLDPYRHGQEQFACNEDSPANNYRDATTSKIYYRTVASGDDGRALMGNFTDDYPGCQGRSVGCGWISSTSDKIISELNGDAFIAWGDLNQRIYWDGDLCDEYFDSPGTEGYGAIYKPASNSASGARWNFGDSKCSNWSKNNPGAIGDIFGDWREELVMRKGDNTAILVYTTGIPTTYRIPTLWHDHQYRNAMVWQSMGYNQPPHQSFFVGKMEGITVAPPPVTMTGRTEVANGGTITTTDDHLIVCETNDTKINIQDGASPYMVTFNIPSWVQGNAGSNATTNPDITYTYYTCDVTGGALTGSTRVVKQGDGILNLPKVNMTYTGETNIWAGTLNFDGTLKNSSLWLNRFAELNSNGGTFRSIKADYASIIRPGGKDVVGSLTTDTLVLGFGSRVQIDLNTADQSCDKLNTKLITVERKSGTAWEKYGPEYIQPVLEVVPHLAAGETLIPAGTYDLGSADQVSGNLSDIKIEGISGEKSELQINNGELYLIITGVRDATTVYWTGSESSTWDYANAMNFDNSGTSDFFVSGDQVVFDDAAKKFTVTLEGELDPDSVVFNNSKTYTLNGTGAIVGNASLVKRGTGIATLGNDNTYTGTTLISGGTLKVSSLSNANQEKGNLGVVSTDTKHIILENGGELQTTADVTMGTPIRVQTDEGGVINNTSGFSMNKAFYGTLLTKKGSGWLTCYATNTGLTKMTIAAGTVNQSTGVPATKVELQGGSLVDGGAGCLSTPIYVAKGKSGSFTLSSAYYTAYTNALTGEGTITIIPTNTVSRVRITGNWSQFYGTIKHTTTNIWLPLDMSTAATHATLDIASGCTVANVPGNSLTIGAVTGSGSLNNAGCNYKNSSGVSGVSTWNIGNSDDNNFTFEGTINDNSSTNTCAFSKVGSCKMTMKTAGSTLSGAVKVSAGELCLNNSSTNAMLGTGSLTVSKGAMLSGKAVLTNSATTIASGATIRSGISETSATGNLQFSGKNLTVNGTAQVYASTKSSYCKFSNIGTLKLNGTLKINLGTSYKPLDEGSEMALFDAESITLGSNFAVEIPAGYLCDTSRLASEGVVVISIDPNYDGIATLSMDDAEGKTFYTLDGVRLNGVPSRQGIYIVNGRKTLLK